MSVEAHLSDLAEQHKVLDRKIREELDKPGSDDMAIAAMKREKLRLKDEMSKVTKPTQH
jgi:hypothetical protein